MASKISINLDTSKENYLVAKCKQNDDLTLETLIYENGSILDLTTKEISIQALKADNTYIIQNTNIVKEKNKILAELDRDFSRVSGTTKIEIVLNESGKQNTTFSFSLEVIGSVIKGAVQSSDAITALEEVQAAVTEIGRINEETQTLVNNAGAASKEDFNKVNASLEQKAIEKTTMELKCLTDGISDDSLKINEFLNGGNDRFLFLNQGVYNCKNKILINNPNTSIKGNAYARGWTKDRLRKSCISANHTSDILEVNIGSSENGSFIENISLYGNDTANNGLVIGDYEFSGNEFRGINVLNCLNNGYTLKGNNYGTYYKKLFCTNVKNGIVIEKGNSHNLDFEGCNIYANEVCLDLLTNVESTLNTSKSITFYKCDFTHLGDVECVRMWVKTGKCRNVIFDSCYFESPSNLLKEYLIELGTNDFTTSTITFKNCNFSFKNTNYIFKLTNVLWLNIIDCYFESVPNKAYFLASTNITNTKQQAMFGYFRSVISRNIPLIGALEGDTPMQLNKVFSFFSSLNSISSSHQEGGFSISGDNTKSVLKGYDIDRTEFPIEKVVIKTDGIYIGDGKTVPLTALRRLATGELYIDGNVWLQGKYNQTPLRIANLWLFSDSSNNLRVKKGSAPTSETDGQIVNLI